MKGPLSGYKIIEFATYVAAPSGVRILADWGAEVIKIEVLQVMTIARIGTCIACLEKVIFTIPVSIWLA